MSSNVLKLPGLQGLANPELFEQVRRKLQTWANDRVCDVVDRIRRIPGHDNPLRQFAIPEPGERDMLVEIMEDMDPLNTGHEQTDLYVSETIKELGDGRRVITRKETILQLDIVPPKSSDPFRFVKKWGGMSPSKVLETVAFMDEFDRLYPMSAGLTGNEEIGLPRDNKGWNLVASPSFVFKETLVETKEGYLETAHRLSDDGIATPMVEEARWLQKSNPLLGCKAAPKLDPQQAKICGDIIKGVKDNLEKIEKNFLREFLRNQEVHPWTELLEDGSKRVIVPGLCVEGKTLKHSMVAWRKASIMENNIREMIPVKAFEALKSKLPKAKRELFIYDASVDYFTEVKRTEQIIGFWLEPKKEEVK